MWIFILARSNVAVECMLASLIFSRINKNKIIFKQLPTDLTVESSIAADTMIINCIIGLLMPFKYHNNTSQYASEEDN